MIIQLWVCWIDPFRYVKSHKKIVRLHMIGLFLVFGSLSCNSDVVHKNIVIFLNQTYTITIGERELVLIGFEPSISMVES